MTGPSIFFAGYLDPGSTARHRVDALRRLGYRVIPFNLADYGRGSGRILNWVYYHLLVGPEIDRVNRDIMREAARCSPRFIYIEKGIFLRARTVRYLSEAIAPTIQFNYDNPFGTRGDPGWRLFLAAMPFYDIHFVPRESSIADFERAGARRVFRMPLSFDPAVHFPPPPGWGERDRTIDISFTGTHYDDRGAFLSSLLTDYGIETDLMGDRWNRVLSPEVAARLWKGPSVYDDAYRERFWRSKICLSFVTHSNRDQVAHKSFEIAASGGFLLAEATEEHRAMFEDGEEAVFFEDVADCARLIRRYLPDAEARARIAKAGQVRAVNSGYSNDARLKAAFGIVEDIFPERR